MLLNTGPKEGLKIQWEGIKYVVMTCGGQGRPTIRCVINLPNLYNFGKSFHVSADLSLLFVAISRKENIYIKKSQEIFL